VPPLRGLPEATRSAGGASLKSPLTFDRLQMLTIRRHKATSKTKKKRIRWNRSPSLSVVGYRIYWAVAGEVRYDSEFIDIGDRTEVVLPDQVPSLQHVRGEVALGITAVNREGNESDMVRFTVNFDSLVQGVSAGLLRPGVEGWEPPTKASVLVDDLHFWLVRNSSPQESGQSTNMQDYYAESHHVEEVRR
jgi:hypothetical protein